MAYKAIAIRRTDKDSLTHWKYIKRVKKGDSYRYYYDESKGGSSESKDDKSKESETDTKSTSDYSDGFDLDEVANKIIKGEFSNGEERKKLLGESYADVQHRVNQILLGEEKAKAILERKTKK